MGDSSARGINGDKDVLGARGGDNAGEGKHVLDQILRKTRNKIVSNHTHHLLGNGGRVGAVEQLHPLSLFGAEPFGLLLDVITQDLLIRLELATVFTDELTVADPEEGLVACLEVDQLGEEILRTFGTGQTKQRSVGHLKDGNNDLEEEIRRNVRHLIDDDQVGSHTASCLKQNEKLVSIKHKTPEKSFR